MSQNHRAVWVGRHSLNTTFYFTGPFIPYTADHSKQAGLPLSVLLTQREKALFSKGEFSAKGQELALTHNETERKHRVVQENL